MKQFLKVGKFKEPEVVKIAKTLKMPRYYKRKLKLIGKESS